MIDNVNHNQVITNVDEVSFKAIVVKIKRWFNYLLSNYIIIVIASVIGLAGGVIYSTIKKTVYKAELSFALQDQKSSSLSGAAGLASQFGIDLSGTSAGGEFVGDNIIELMKSRSIIEKTLLSSITIDNKTTTLVEFYIASNNIRDNWKNDPQLRNLHYLPNSDRSKFSLQQDSVLGEFFKKILANDIFIKKIDNKLNIISLKVEANNELFAKIFSETLVSCVSDFYVQTTIRKEKANVEILQRQTDSVRRALNVAISGVASSIDDAPNANPFNQSLRVPSQRRQVDVQANTAILNELVKNLEAAKMSLLQETPLIQVIDKPILPLEKTKLGKTKAALMGIILSFIVAIVLLTINKLFKALLV